MILRHIVLFHWKEAATDEQVAAVSEGLAEMPEVMPFIRRYEFGGDAGVSQGGADMALVADFDSVDDWNAYREHPVHRRLLDESILPITERLERSQLWLE